MLDTSGWDLLPPGISSGEGLVSPGDVYNRLTAVEFIGTTRRKQKLWLWKCSCGNDKLALAASVKCGNATSCGCYGAEQVAASVRKHGHRETPEYNVWCHIKSRCYNPKNEKYALYGGRGITVCDEWLNSFEAFLKDVGYRPRSGYSIDRIDTNGNYEPGNCRWSTQKEQCNNRRNNSRLMFRGEVKTLAYVAETLKTDPSRIRYLLRAGYQMDDIEHRIVNGLSFKKNRPQHRQLLHPREVFINYQE